MSPHTSTDTTHPGLDWAALRASAAFLVAGRNLYLTAAGLWLIWPLLLIATPVVLAGFAVTALARATNWPIAITAAVGVLAVITLI